MSPVDGTINPESFGDVDRVWYVNHSKILFCWFFLFRAGRLIMQGLSVRQYIYSAWYKFTCSVCVPYYNFKPILTRKRKRYFKQKRHVPMKKECWLSWSQTTIHRLPSFLNPPPFSLYTTYNMQIQDILYPYVWYEAYGSFGLSPLRRVKVQADVVSKTLVKCE